MRIPSVFTGLVASLLLWSSDATAADYALILANQTYDNAPAEPRAASFVEWRDMLRNAGFEVFGGPNRQTAIMVRAAEEFRHAIGRGDADRIVVVVSGRVVATATDSWLLGKEYKTPSALSVGRLGVSLGGLNQLLGDHEGHGLLVVAPSWSSREAAGPGLRVGARVLAPAEGVAVMDGPADKLMPLVRRAVTGTRQPLGQIARNLPSGVALRGYLPIDRPLGREVVNRVDDSDRAYWSAVRDLGTVDAYRSYLNRFPNGLFAAEARRLIAAAQDDPRRRAEAEEQALGLSRNDRISIQRDLTLLGFGTGGVDGVFGPRTRAAIRNFQANRQYAQSGYLTAPQVAQIHREAAQRRSELERADREYWGLTGALGTIPGLNAYLDRYPNGIYADSARRRLDEQDHTRQEEAAWDRARRLDTLAAYRDFVRRFPASRHTAAARRRIAELERTTFPNIIPLDRLLLDRIKPD